MRWHITDKALNIAGMLREYPGDEVHARVLPVGMSPAISAGMATTNSRDRKNGQYTHSDMDAICKCGHSLGTHAAETVRGERPCFHGDDHEDDPCECTKFRKG